MKKSLLAAILGTFLLVGISHADPLTLVQAGSVNGSNAWVNILGKDVNTFAAYYQLNFNNVNYMGYCVDYADINWDTRYGNYSMIQISDVLDSTLKDRYRQAAWVFETYGTNPETSGVNVQLAIWEIMFDANPGTVKSSGPNEGFYVTSASGLDLGIADNYIKNARNNYSDFDPSAYRLLVSPDTTEFYGQGNQDFMVKTPEPGVLALLGIGLLGLFLATRKKIIS